MNPHDPQPLPLALALREDPPGTLVLSVDGDLDHETSPDVLALVRSALAGHPGPAALRLDLSGLGVIDSMGLSALLMIRRLTGDAGAALWLDGRPEHLDRLLDLTGTREHLTGGG